MNVEFWVYILILASWPCVARAQDCGEVCQYDGFTELEPGPPFPRIEKNFSCRAIIERTLRPHKPPHKSPISVPKEQMAAYTMNHTATVMRWYFNEVMQSGTHHWTTSMCRAYATPKCIPKRLNYAEWGCALYKYLTKYRMLLAGKVIGVLGSQLPWIECKLLQLGVRQVWGQILGRYSMEQSFFGVKHTLFELIMGMHFRVMSSAEAQEKGKHAPIGVYPCGPPLHLDDIFCSVQYFNKLGKFHHISQGQLN